MERGSPSEGTAVDTSRESTNLRDSIRIFTERENLLSATTLQTTRDGGQMNT